MRKIALYPDGSKGYIKTDGNSTVLVNGKEPIKLLEPTEENIEKHFKNVNLPKDGDTGVV